MPPAEPAAPKPAEERSYVAFAAIALFFVLVVGLGLGVAIPLTGGDEALVRAHAAAQLQGWLGLFVAGMALRLVPRLSGRRPFPTALTALVLVLLVSGVLLRVAAVWASGLAVPAAAAWALGSIGLAVALGIALASRGRPWQAWRVAAWCGAAWWLGWAALGLGGAIRTVAGTVPPYIDAAWQWTGVIGALSNFAWAVQSRSVPVFFGRRPPGLAALLPPLVALNLGVALVAVSAFHGPARAPGLALAGLATAWLAPLAGSVWGSAHRLRPVSRPAARFVVAANAWAVVAGLLLIASAAVEMDSLRDAALHALGLGFMTTLIVGMAQLLTPVFAGERMALLGWRPELHLSLPLLIAAAVFRVAASFLGGAPQAAVIATSGVLAWVGLAVFAFRLVRLARVTRGVERRA